MTATLHQIDLSHADTIPMSAKCVAIPYTIATQPGGLLRDKNRSITNVPQEKVTIIGTVTKHVDWDSASKLAADLMTRDSVDYTLYSQHTTPAYVHTMNAVPSSVTIRNAGVNGAITAMPLDAFRDLAATALFNEGTTKIDNATSAPYATPMAYPLVANTTASVWKVKRYQLSAGVPKSQRMSGRPSVFIDRYDSGDYVVYAIWGLATFEGLYVESGLAAAASLLSALTLQPASFQSFLSSVLGVVETVVRIGRTVAEILAVKDFIIVSDPSGPRLVNEKADIPDSLVSKDMQDACEQLMLAFTRAKSLRDKDRRAIKSSPKDAKQPATASRKRKPKAKKGKKPPQ